MGSKRLLWGEKKWSNTFGLKKLLVVKKIVVQKCWVERNIGPNYILVTRKLLIQNVLFFLHIFGWDWCFYFPKTGPFRYQVSQKIIQIKNLFTYYWDHLLWQTRHCQIKVKQRNTHRSWFHDHRDPKGSHNKNPYLRHRNISHLVDIGEELAFCSWCCGM